MILLQIAQPGAPLTDEILDRVVNFAGGQDPCSGPELSYSGRIDKAIAKDSALVMTPGSGRGSYIVATTNRSGQPLVTASSAGPPVWLS